MKAIILSILFVLVSVSLSAKTITVSAYQVKQLNQVITGSIEAGKFVSYKVVISDKAEKTAKVYTFVNEKEYNRVFRLWADARTSKITIKVK